MRVSTGMIFDANVATINRQTATLLHLQQQVSTGRRILTPADDPVGAARALEVSQSRSVLAQFAVNHDNAQSALGLAEAQLAGVNEIFARIKELTVQAGNATLSSGDRRSLAFELRARYDELLGIANSADGQGLYLFSGYMGTTKPFGGTVDFLNAGNEIIYDGDDGQRRLQVSATRFLEVSDSGNDVFRRIRNGNGHFVTHYGNNILTLSPNLGTGVIDAGSVTDPAAWNALTNQNFEIRFYIDTATLPPTTYYEIVDTIDNVSMTTGGPPATAPIPFPAGLQVYEEGQPIPLPTTPGGAASFGSVTITGEPADGDTFSIAPSTAQSIFKTLANLIAALESANTGLAADDARYVNRIGFALRDFDQANDNILRVRAAIGSRMSELASLRNVNADLDLQYQQALSTLQDLDYAKAISDLTRKQVDLQAAQQSFVQISRLSIFNYL